jgi:hypothetical protein
LLQQKTNKQQFYKSDAAITKSLTISGAMKLLDVVNEEAKWLWAHFAGLQPHIQGDIKSCDRVSEGAAGYEVAATPRYTGHSGLCYVPRSFCGHPPADPVYSLIQHRNVHPTCTCIVPSHHTPKQAGSTFGVL